MPLERRRYKNPHHRQNLCQLICQEIRILDRPLTAKELADHLNKEKLHAGAVTAEMVLHEVAANGESLKHETDAKGRSLINVNIKTAFGND